MKSKKISAGKIKTNSGISVIIPTYNSWKTLKDCLWSIKKQTIKPLEIVVVDNASTDGTSNKLKKVFPGVKLVKKDRNIGVTGGRNAGIEEANKKSRYLLFLDHDMVADESLFEELLKAAKRLPDVGIFTPKIFYWEDKKRVWAAGTNINLWTGQVLFRGGRDNGQFNEIEEVQVAPAALFVKREVINTIHGFDDKYFATYEDTDFCFRAREKGFKTVYIPSAISYHQISPDPSLERKRLLGRSFWIGRNRVLFMGDFGKNLWFFFLSSPIYLFYFIKLSVDEGKIDGLLNYVKGYVAGIVEVVFARKILFHLPYSIYNLLWRNIGDGRKTVLDVGCGDGRIMDILNPEREWKVTGIDIYEPDVTKAKETGAYESVLVDNIVKMDKIFKKKFDVVFCSNVLEHMLKRDSLNLMSKFEKLGKRVVIVVPRGFLEKEDPYYFEGDNPYQIHKSAWEIEEFRQYGYEVKGIGVNFLLGEGRFTNRKFWKRYKFLQPVKVVVVILENLLAYVFAPLSYHYPTFSTGILAIKDIEYH